ncbi:MAG TPA: helix-turn-helix domain-containing protein, partial [Acidimicrobiales bacterium]|nr:helix-turn-helix domain-containing protein [Acidimicrobiales bacterium]
YDSRGGRELTKSVCTWIMCNCDIGAAAARLYVHPNTLRYRLQRAEQISGLDLKDPDERMLVHLCCKAPGAGRCPFAGHP